MVMRCLTTAANQVLTAAILAVLLLSLPRSSWVIAAESSSTVNANVNEAARPDHSFVKDLLIMPPNNASSCSPARRYLRGWHERQPIIVSCYYSLDQSKYSSNSSYHEWIGNFMTFLSGHTKVIYGDESSLDYLQSHWPGQLIGPDTVIKGAAETTTNNLWYVLRDIEADFVTSTTWEWKSDRQVDFEPRHNEQLYKIYNEKVFMVQATVLHGTDHNRTSAYRRAKMDQTYVWVDIGAFRKADWEQSIRGFPDPRKFDPNYVTLLQIEDYWAEELDNIDHIDNRFMYVDRISANAFAGNGHALLKFASIHHDTLNEAKTKVPGRDIIFTGQEQMMFAFEVARHPELFTTVHPMRVRYNLWFGLHLVWAPTLTDTRSVIVTVVSSEGEAIAANVLAHSISTNSDHLMSSDGTVGGFVFIALLLRGHFGAKGASAEQGLEHQRVVNALSSAHLWNIEYVDEDIGLATVWSWGDRFDDVFYIDCYSVATGNVVSLLSELLGAQFTEDQIIGSEDASVLAIRPNDRVFEVIMARMVSEGGTRSLVQILRATFEKSWFDLPRNTYGDVQSLATSTSASVDTGDVTASIPILINFRNDAASGFGLSMSSDSPPMRAQFNQYWRDLLTQVDCQKTGIMSCGKAPTLISKVLATASPHHFEVWWPRDHGELFLWNCRQGVCDIDLYCFAGITAAVDGITAFSPPTDNVFTYELTGKLAGMFDPFEFSYTFTVNHTLQFKDPMELTLNLQMPVDATFVNFDGVVKLVDPARKEDSPSNMSVMSQGNPVVVATISRSLRTVVMDDLVYVSSSSSSFGEGAKEIDRDGNDMHRYTVPHERNEGDGGSEGSEEPGALPTHRLAWDFVEIGTTSDRSCGQKVLASGDGEQATLLAHGIVVETSPSIYKSLEKVWSQKKRSHPNQDMQDIRLVNAAVVTSTPMDSPGIRSVYYFPVSFQNRLVSRIPWQYYSMIDRIHPRLYIEMQRNRVPHTLVQHAYVEAFTMHQLIDAHEITQRIKLLKIGDSYTEAQAHAILWEALTYFRSSLQQSGQQMQQMQQTPMSGSTGDGISLDALMVYSMMPCVIMIPSYDSKGYPIARHHPQGAVPTGVHPFLQEHLVDVAGYIVFRFTTLYQIAINCDCSNNDFKTASYLTDIMLSKDKLCFT
jgi:hypothetical protein